MFNEKKIILITCYFGNFPWYFPLFLNSSKYNPTIDFIIYSDCKWEYKIPENVRIVSFTLNNFNRLATIKLGFDISVKTPYKLCDFKPAYGMIFHDDIKHYDFWGITDIDIVFGRIREFMSEELLERYEVVSVRHDYPTGFFMLFKNIKKINMLFTKSKDYKNVFTSDIHYCFDECNFKHDYLQDGGDIFKIDCDIESMQYVIKKEENVNNLKAHFDFLIIEGIPGQLKWENGMLTYKNEYEVLLHHLIRYKSHHYTRKKFWKDVPNTFYINKYSISKRSFTHILEFQHLYLFNKIKPYFKEIIFRTEFFMSKALGLNLKDIPNNDYISNGRILKISKDFKNCNQISLKDFRPRKIFKAVLSKNSFFMDSIPIAKYQLIDENTILVESYIQGHFDIYDKYPNISNEELSTLQTNRLQGLRPHLPSNNNQVLW